VHEDDGYPEGYALVGTAQVYASRWSSVRHDTIRLPDGSTTVREIVDHPSAVAAVVVDADDRVVLVRQYRHALRRLAVEIPAGKLDVHGEDPAEAMQRELEEEVGLRAGDLEPLLTYDNSAGWTSERTTVYLATDPVASSPPEDFRAEHEEAHMQVLRLPFDEALAMARDGRITDGKSVIGLLAVADRRRR
jgi:8-oxo-dGDP phosphatase